MSMDKSPGYEVWQKRNTHFGGAYKIPATCCKTKDDGLRDMCQKDPNEHNAYLEVCNFFLIAHAYYLQVSKLKCYSI